MEDTSHLTFQFLSVVTFKPLMTNSLALKVLWFKTKATFIGLCQVLAHLCLKLTVFPFVSPRKESVQSPINFNNTLYGGEDLFVEIGLQGEGQRLETFLAWHTVEKHYECFRHRYGCAGHPSQSRVSAHSTSQWNARQGRFYNPRPWLCNPILTDKSLTLSRVPLKLIGLAQE